jgi:hypothetical protein
MIISVIKKPRRCYQHPEARPIRRSLMDRRSVLQDAVPNEVRRTILREALDRFNHELLDDRERQELLDRIKRLRRQLRLA